HERVRLEHAPERGALPGVLEGLECAAPHDRCRRRGDADAGGVDHVEHLLHAALEVPDLPGEGAAEARLAAGHATGAELVLETMQDEGVVAAVLQLARDEEEAEPARSGD